MNKYEGHTEGKWTLEKVEQTDDEPEHYLLIGNNLILSKIHHGGQEWDEHEANALLIADAPLLLGLVIYFKSEVERLQKRNEWLEEVLALAQEHGAIDLSDYGWPQWGEGENDACE
tara:strand:- start:182 stop:529 length:348 start_codon:yes stop_codon:yes gene_type:complete